MPVNKKGGSVFSMALWLPDQVATLLKEQSTPKKVGNHCPSGWPVDLWKYYPIDYHESSIAFGLPGKDVGRDTMYRVSVYSDLSCLCCFMGGRGVGSGGSFYCHLAPIPGLNGLPGQFYPHPIFSHPATPAKPSMEFLPSVGSLASYHQHGDPVAGITGLPAMPSPSWPLQCALRHICNGCCLGSKQAS